MAKSKSKKTPEAEKADGEAYSPLSVDRIPGKRSR